MHYCKGCHQEISPPDTYHSEDCVELFISFIRREEEAQRREEQFIEKEEALLKRKIKLLIGNEQVGKNIDGK